MIILIPKLLNSPFASCSFINFFFLLPHTPNVHDKNGRPLLALKDFELTLSVFHFLLRL